MGIRRACCSGRAPEGLKTQIESIAVRLVLGTSRIENAYAAGGLASELEEGTVVDVEEPVRDMDDAIGVDAEQIAVEGGVVDLGQRQTIRDDRVTQFLIGIANNVGGVEKARLG